MGKGLLVSKDELIKMSNDEKQQELYAMRSKILKDKISALNQAKQEGREEGILQGIKEEKMRVVEALLDVLEDDVISLKTGVDIEEIRKMRNNK